MDSSAISAYSDHHVHKMVLVGQTKTEVHTGSWGCPGVAVDGCKSEAWHRALHLYHSGKTPSLGIPPPCFPFIHCREDTRNTEVYFKK